MVGESQEVTILLKRTGRTAEFQREVEKQAMNLRAQFENVEVLTDISSKAPQVFFLVNLFRFWPLINLPLAIHGEALMVAPYSHSLFHPVVDKLLRVQTSSKLTEEQWVQLREAKVQLEAHAEVKMNLSQVYTVFKKSEETSSDVVMVFVVPWKKNMDPAVSEDLWRHHASVLPQYAPAEMKTYIQVHTQGDPRIQGLALFHVSSLNEVKNLALQAGAWKQNMKLIAEENKFIGPPEFVLMRAE